MQAQTVAVMQCIMPFRVFIFAHDTKTEFLSIAHSLKEHLEPTFSSRPYEAEGKP